MCENQAKVQPQAGILRINKQRLIFIEGDMMPRKLYLLIIALVLIVSAVPALAQDNVFEDPNGLFSVVVPTNWTVEVVDDVVTLTDPDGKSTVYVLAIPGEDVSQAITDAWAKVAPEFTFEPQNTQEVPSSPGVDQTVVLSRITDDQSRLYQGYGQRVGEMVYIQLYDVDVVAAQQRQAQINVIATGFKILALDETDLTGVEALPLTPELTAEFEAYVNDLLEKLEVPGASIAVVQDGEIVYEQGFGVREIGTDEPVTPDTLMMIGSTGKSFTTMMMAILVDAGLMDWDTKVVDILPTFAVHDPDVTDEITVRNLVCACTGVPRRDLEWVFNTYSAQQIVESLKDYTFFTDFGEAFQYSNQMVTTGGYVATIAAGGSYDTLYEDFTAELQRRVLDPIGMPNTTFSFEQVTASDNYSTPHGINFLGDYYILPMKVEELLLQVAPAGALWSNAPDMARYIITELSEGVSPDGKRVVSAENLKETWQPQVEVTADISYGLGWLVDEYHGLQMIQHGGNTFGFTSDFAFLPEADLGVVVLSNARLANVFTEAARTKLLSLVFEQESEYDDIIDYLLEQDAINTAKLEEQLQDYDAETVAPYLGTFRNDILGDITISEQNGKLMLDAGEFTSDLRVRVNDEGETEYLTVETPATGVPFEFIEEDGQPVIRLDIVTDVYTFEKSE